ncbi:MAG: hypothetical protein ABJX35_01640 [Hyphomicrobiales bacterium]
MNQTAFIGDCNMASSLPSLSNFGVDLSGKLILSIAAIFSLQENDFGDVIAQTMTAGRGSATRLGKG